MKKFLISLLILSCSSTLLLSPTHAECIPYSFSETRCDATHPRCDAPRRDVCCNPKSECPLSPAPPPGGPSGPSGSTDVFCGGGLGVNTAIGCLMAGDPKQAVSQILGWAIVVGGGIAFLLTVYAGFQITTAQGDPKRLQAGQELLTSALSGLFLIVFSVVILNFIGVQVLGLGLWFTI